MRFARRSILRDPRHAPGARDEPRVATTTLTSARDDDLLAGRREIRDTLAGRVVHDDRALGDAHDHVTAGPAALVLAATGRAVLGGDRLLEPELGERRRAAVDAEHHAAALTAIAAVGAAPRDVGLAAEGDDPAPAVAALHCDPHAIEEHR